MNNKLLHFALMVVAVAMLVLVFVFTFVNQTTSIVVTEIDTSLAFGDLTESDYEGALGTFITALATVVLAGVAIVVALGSSFKVFRGGKLAKFVGVLSALCAVACMVFSIVLTSTFVQADVFEVSTISIGLAPFAALLGGLLCAVAMLVVKEPKAKRKPTKKPTKKSSKKK